MTLFEAKVLLDALLVCTFTASKDLKNIHVGGVVAAEHRHPALERRLAQQGAHAHALVDAKGLGLDHGLAFLQSDFLGCEQDVMVLQRRF